MRPLIRSWRSRRGVGSESGARRPSGSFAAGSGIMMGDPRAPRCRMSRHRQDPLRPLTPDERIALTRLSRSPSAPAAQVERARALVAIADGASYTAAAHQIGRRHNETISAWVSRFNRDGLAAVRPGHGGGPRIRYGADAQQRILAEWARTPRREQDG